MPKKIKNENWHLTESHRGELPVKTWQRPWTRWSSHYVMLVSHYDINDDEDEGRIGNDDYDVWPIFLSLYHNEEFGQVVDNHTMTFIVIFSCGDIGDLGQVDDNDDDVCCNLWRPWASRCSLATGWPGSGGWTKSYRVYVYQDLCQAYIGVDRGNSVWILFRGLVEALFCYLWPPLLGWRSGEKHQGCVVGKSLEVLVVVNLEQRGKQKNILLSSTFPTNVLGKFLTSVPSSSRTT